MANRAIAYELDENDLIDFNVWHYARSPYTRGLRRSRFLIAAIAFPLVFAVFALNDVKSAAIGVLVAMAIAAVIALPVWRWRIRADTRKRLTMGKRTGETGLQQLTLMKGELVRRNDGGELRATYASIEGLVDSERFSAIYLSPDRALFVPRRKVEQAELHAFLTALKDRVRESAV